MDADLDRDRPAGDESAEPRVPRLSLHLRTTAFALLIVGFVGAVTADTAPISPDSVYSYVFFAGVACAIASIYLGILRGGASGD